MTLAVPHGASGLPHSLPPAPCTASDAGGAGAPVWVRMLLLTVMVSFSALQLLEVRLSWNLVFKGEEEMNTVEHTVQMDPEVNPVLPFFYSSYEKLNWKASLQELVTHLREATGHTPWPRARQSVWGGPQIFREIFQSIFKSMKTPQGRRKVKVWEDLHSPWGQKKM